MKVGKDKNAEQQPEVTEANTSTCRTGFSAVRGGTDRDHGREVRVFKGIMVHTRVSQVPHL